MYFLRKTNLMHGLQYVQVMGNHIFSYHALNVFQIMR